jgi:hypothetical protein
MWGILCRFELKHDIDFIWSARAAFCHWKPALKLSNFKRLSDIRVKIVAKIFLKKGFASVVYDGSEVKKGLFYWQCNAFD